jgi:hypothetical protein
MASRPGEDTHIGCNDDKLEEAAAHVFQGPRAAIHVLGVQLDDLARG